MTGIAIWAHSVCRSVFALYREIGRHAGVPVKIAVWKESERGSCGFEDNEFADLDIVQVGDDIEKARRFLDETKDFVQIFTTYQVAPAYRWAIAAAKARGDRLIAYAEAPSNMECGWRRLAKEIYLRTVVPSRSRHQIAAFEKLICASGNNYKRALQAGWPREKIVPFGYSVPILNHKIGQTCFMENSNCNTSPFTVLSTGVLTWYRGSDVFIRALCELKRRGVAFEAVVTQEGPLKASLEKLAQEKDLPVRFVGRVSVDELAQLYRTCDVFVASGREEPWGMRVNDAINLGAPVIVSDGMGAAKMVEDSGCGCVVPSGDADAIADCLERMAREPEFLSKLRSAVPLAAQSYSVESMAAKFLKEL